VTNPKGDARTRDRPIPVIIGRAGTRRVNPVRPDTPYCVLFIGIPTYNEATTIGVLLWRLRTVLSDVSREYEVVVYDDASTDDTIAVLEPYTRVLPLTLLRGTRRLGTGRAIDALVRHVARSTRYPRRDGLLLMQADFTDSPAMVPEFLRRFEGGADLIIGERASAGDAPIPVRRLYAASRWVLRPFVGITDVRDLTSSFRLARIAVLRDLLKASGDAPVAAGEAWMAQADFLLRAAPHARRVETIPVTPTFAVRTRETRRTAWPDTLALAKWGWSHRGQRIAAKVIARTVEAPAELADPVEVAEVERPEKPERRERVAEPVEKRSRRERGGERREREERDDAATASPRPPRAPRPKRPAPSAEPVAAAPTTSDDIQDAAIEGDGARERGTRKRRRGKRGAKRAGTAVEAGAEGTEVERAADTSSTLSPPPRQRAEDNAEGADGDATTEAREHADRETHEQGVSSAEPKRRRARRGRRKRGEGRGSEARDGESPDGERGDREVSDDRAPGDHRAPDEHGDGGGHESVAGEAAHDRAEGDRDRGDDGGPRRRNRRGRRGGRRRSGGGESAGGGAGGDSGNQEPGPSDD
jgi:hypothetical protein